MSSCVIYKNIIAASPFVAVLGLGAGAAFYLYFRHQCAGEEKERALAAARGELNNLDYLIRKDLASLPDELQGEFSGAAAEVATAIATISRELVSGRPETVAKELAGLAERSFTIRKRLAELDLEGREQELLSDERIAAVNTLLPKLSGGTRERLAAELAQIAAAADRGQMLATLEKLLQTASRSLRVEQLSARGAEREDRFEPETPDDPAASLIAEVERFHRLIKGYDEAAYAELRTRVASLHDERSRQRREMIRDMVKLRYGRLKEETAATMVRREGLAKIIEGLQTLEGTAALISRGEALVGLKFIDRRQYDEFARACADHRASLAEEALLLADMREKLARMGYSVADEEAAGLSADKPVFFATGQDGYQVLVRLGGQGEILTRLVRFVASEQEKVEISGYQRQKDREAGRKWCRDFDAFIATLNRQGYVFETLLRKEPEEEKILCIVDPLRATRTGQIAATLPGATAVKERNLE